MAVVGMGLIGASIGLALRRARPACQVVGVSRRQSSLQTALRRGAVTEVTLDLAAGVRHASLIVVCTPVGLVAGQVREVAGHCTRQALITDAGSTKQRIVTELPGCFRGPDGGAGPVFIGSHPLAGSEKSGAEAAREDLFDERLVVITPTPEHAEPDVRRLTDFWQTLGARVRVMEPAEHDAVLARTSHAPHVIAAALAAATDERDLPLTAGGWRDTTRIAAGDPEMWLQILCDNRDHVLKSLGEFGKKLSAFQQALSNGDQARLRELLETGKTRRDALGS
ncbi:MAG: prephenate dehydrogenase/arogenate dehydrogenase family protein [Pirellulaceae bacterium]|nr:prephenate dehydrogenase/arogenate dehydrogenase family protein [Pirellulaceae bacterium]